MMTGPVLCTYARRDKAHCQFLLRHLQTTRPAPVILDWHSVSPGDALTTERERWLAKAQTIVHLLSAEFFADMACRTAALEVVARRPIPMLLRSVTLPKELADLVVVPLPRGGSPLVALGRNCDALRTEIVGESHDVMAAHPAVPPRSIGAELEFHPEGLRAEWPARRSLLDEAARELGVWLYVPFASERLRRLVEARRQRQTRARLILVIPDDYADWPWELAYPPRSDDSPAVHEALTVCASAARRIAEIRGVTADRQFTPTARRRREP